MRHDVCNPLKLEVDEIYNLACPASPVHYQYNPVLTTKTSVMGAMNMLGLAKRLRCRIFQASTSEVYGDPEVHPQREDYWGHVNPIGTRACYDEGKRCAETLFFDYHRQHGVEIKVARIFNTYGPRMHPRDGRVVSNFITQALTGEDLTIYGDGSQTRSFCYVDDLDRGLPPPHGVARRGDRPRQPRQPRRIHHDRTGRAGAEAHRARARRSSTMPLPQDDPRQRQPDITLARATLGWEPKVPLAEGLEHTIDYFKQLALSSMIELSVLDLVPVRAGPHGRARRCRKVRHWPAMRRRWATAASGSPSTTTWKASPVPPPPW